MMRTKNVVQGALMSAGLFAVVSLAQPSVAHAQSDAASQAETLNNEGKALIKQLDLKGAAAKFREALALSDDPRFAFNLCYTLEKSGVLREAKEACERALEADDSRLKNKANRLLASIEKRLPAEPAPQPTPQPPTTQPPTTQPPTTQPPTQPGQPTPGAPNSSEPPPAPPPSPEPVAEPPQPTFGAMAGISRSTMKTQFDGVDAAIGVAVGGMVVVNRRERFETVVDAQLVNRGFSIDGISDAPGPDLPVGEGKLVSTYIDVTLTSRWLLGHGSAKPYLEAGATVSLLLSANFEVDGLESDADLEGFDFGYTIGAGTRIAVGSREIDLRARYILGLLNTNKSRSDTVGSNENAHNRALLIQGGLWF